MQSLNVKLVSAMLFIVAITVSLMVLLTSLISAYEYRQFVMRGSAAYTQMLTDNLEQYYTAEKSWTGLQQAIGYLSLATTDRLMVANTLGVIFADTQGEAVGRNISQYNVGSGYPLESAGRSVGNLYILSSGPGRGSMGMHGQSGSPMMVSVYDNSELIAKVNASIWQTGIIAAVAASVAGIFLTRQITRPIKALDTGAGKLAGGEFSYRVEVKSRDEIGRLAGSFNSMAESLEKGERARRQLSADITHELKTPLAVIEATADSILDGVYQPDPEHLRTIKQQVGLLTRLINEMKDLSLAESGQLKLMPEQIDLVELLEKLLAQHRVHADSKGVKLSFNHLEPLQEVVADPGRISQVVTNLLTNAIRHTSAGGRVEVNLAREARQITIAITDTGEGIKSEDLPHVFDRFYRAGTSRSRSEGGTGLGLAIARKLVEAHGGSIRAESTFGQGSSFIFSIPAG